MMTTIIIGVLAFIVVSLALDSQQQIRLDPRARAMLRELDNE